MRLPCCRVMRIGVSLAAFVAQRYDSQVAYPNSVRGFNTKARAKPWSIEVSI